MGVIFYQKDRYIFYTAIIYLIAVLISSIHILNLLVFVKICLIGFLMISVATCEHHRIMHLHQRRVFMTYKQVFYVVYFAVTIEFLVANIFGISIYDDSRMLVRYGPFVRPFFLFTEPSVLCVYVVFSYIIFDLYEKFYSDGFSSIILKILCISVIIMTVSFSGMVLLGGYFFTDSIRKLFKNISITTVFHLIIRYTVDCSFWLRSIFISRIL